MILRRQQIWLSTVWVLGFWPLSLPAETEQVTLATADELEAEVHTVCDRVRGRPCVGLVLGGGGARGSAHIGVLRALEERGIPVDLVVGTSIGAFVGGLYASGKSASEIEQLFRSADWNAGYRDDLSRSRIPNRRKRQIDHYPIQVDLGLGADGISLPQGFLQGQGMKALVDSILGSYRHFASFDQLPIPFRAVAGDAETGEEVLLESGDLATALQISMSIPGVVRPIEVDDRLLVDGGIANNLPVSVARAMGADIVIAVEIGTPPKKKDELTSGVAILRQMTSFLVKKNVEYQKSLLGPQDLLLEPDLGDIGTLSFDRAVEGIASGYSEAQAELSNSPAILALGEMPRRPSAGPMLLSERELPVDRIALVNHSRLGDDYILHRMQLKPGATYRPEEIQEGIDRMYGQGTIARINSSVWEAEGESVLGLYVGEKEWGPGYLDFKLSLEDDFSSFSRYQIGGSYRLTNLSPYGAEWFSSAEFGTDKKLLTELYWPLQTSGFYLTSAIGAERIIVVYDDGDTNLGESVITSGSTLLGVGWNSVDIFDTEIGLVHQQGTLELPGVLQEVLPIDEISFKQSGLQLTLNYDSLDDATFPKRGAKFEMRVARTRDKLSDLIDYTSLVDSELNLVGSIGRHSMRGLIRLQSTANDDPLSLLGVFELGGFLNLSGNNPGAYTGQHVRFASLVYTYELAANNFGAIDLPLYVGFSWETGNAWQEKAEIDYDDMIESHSFFVGWDSPLGPAYLAYGDSDTGRESLYLFLGVLF